MSLTEKEVEHVAKLARLGLLQEQKERLRADLGSILQYMEELNKLDVKNIAPTSHVIRQVNSWREDAVQPFDDTEKILSNAPDREGNFYKVRKVIG